MNVCQFCNRELKTYQAYILHSRACKSNPDRISAPNQFTKNPGTRFSMEARSRMSKAATGKKHTEETKNKLREIAKARKLGGHTSKRRVDFVKKNGEVIHLHSSYEERFAQILEEIDVAWERPEPLIYSSSKGQHRYYPDFLVNGVYVDTKNDYLVKVDAAKIKLVEDQNGVKINIVTEDLINEKAIRDLISS